MVITILLVACEYNVHKGNCFEAIEDCPGTKKKRVSLWVFHYISTPCNLLGEGASFFGNQNFHVIAYNFRN